MLAAGTVEVWYADLAAPAEPLGRLIEALSPAELARAARFRFDVDRLRFTVARGLLRGALAGYLGIPPGDVVIEQDGNHKPVLGGCQARSGLCFSASRSAQMAMFGFARRREVGVDIERVREDADYRELAAHVMSPAEQRHFAATPEPQQAGLFLACWTRKEALLKAMGDGLSRPPSSVTVPLEPGREGGGVLCVDGDDRHPGRWVLGLVRTPPEYLSAVVAERIAGDVPSIRLVSRRPVSRAGRPSAVG